MPNLTKDVSTKKRRNPTWWRILLLHLRLIRQSILIPTSLQDFPTPTPTSRSHPIKFLSVIEQFLLPKQLQIYRCTTTQPLTPIPSSVVVPIPSPSSSPHSHQLSKRKPRADPNLRNHVPKIHHTHALLPPSIKKHPSTFVMRLRFLRSRDPEKIN